MGCKTTTGTGKYGLVLGIALLLVVRIGFVETENGGVELGKVLARDYKKFQDRANPGYWRAA